MNPLDSVRSVESVQQLIHRNNFNIMARHPYQGREDEAWWWGGYPSRYDHRDYNRDPEDDNEYQETY